MEQTADNKQKWDEFMKQDPNEGRVMAMKFTVDGEKLIVREQGKDILKDLPPEDFQGLTEEWKTNKHGKAMATIDRCIELIKTKFPERQLPLTTSEAIHFGVLKNAIRDLEFFGLIRRRIVKVVDEKNGNKVVGGKAILYFTQQGHAYMKIIKTKLAEAKSVEAKQQENTNETA